MGDLKISGLKDKSSNMAYNRDYDNLLNVYKKENDSLKTLIQHFETTIKCRDNMIAQYVQEIQEMKKSIQHQKKTIDSLNFEINTLKNQKLLKDKPAYVPKKINMQRIFSANNELKSKEEHLYLKKPNTQIVTKSQGIGLNTNTFFQENETFSVLFNAGFQKKVTKQRYKKIEDLIKCKGDYFTNFTALSFNDKEEIVVLLISAYRELLSYSKINYKLRGVINLYKNISKISSLNDIILMFSREIPYLLNCYKSHLYLIDEISKELWTPLEEKDQYLKLPFDSKDNAVIYTALHDKIIRIDNAQNDLNFSRNLDNEKNIKIKTILTYPIKNLEEKTFAVIELINKHEGVFTNEDEEFLSLLSNQISVLLLQFIENERTHIKYNKIIKLMDNILELFKCKQIEEFLSLCEQKLQEMVNSNSSSITLIDRKNNAFVRLKDNELIKTGSLDMGIIGKCLLKNEVLESENTKNDIDFNNFVDLETEMPMISFPIRYGDDMIAIGQVIYIRKKLGEKFLKKSFFWEKEFLDYFSKIIGVCIYKLYII